MPDSLSPPPPLPDAAAGPLSRRLDAHHVSFSSLPSRRRRQRLRLPLSSRPPPKGCWRNSSSKMKVKTRGGDGRGWGEGKGRTPPSGPGRPQPFVPGAAHVRRGRAGGGGGSSSPERTVPTGRPPSPAAPAPLRGCSLPAVPPPRETLRDTKYRL